ncbi:MAG: hypothetical protein ACRD82_19500, partial [Blastocatellia bacterium]
YNDGWRGMVVLYKALQRWLARYGRSIQDTTTMAGAVWSLARLGMTDYRSKGLSWQRLDNVSGQSEYARVFTRKNSKLNSEVFQ